MPVSPDKMEQPDGDDPSERAGTGESGQSASKERQEGEETQAPQEEEVQQQRTLRVPEAPSAEKVAEHRSNGHFPDRSWCPECVEAFGREWALVHPPEDFSARGN